MSINYKLAGYRSGLQTLGLNKIADEAAPAQKDEPGFVRKYVVPGAAALAAAGGAYAGHKYMSGGQKPGSDASRYSQLADMLSSKLPTSAVDHDKTVGGTQGPGLGQRIGDAYDAVKGRLSEKGTAAGLPSEAAPAGPGLMARLRDAVSARMPTEMGANPDATTGGTQGPGFGTRVSDAMASMKDRIKGMKGTSVPTGTQV